MQTLPLSEAKDKLSALVDGVEATHEAVVITRHGRPAAILLAPDDLDSLTETVAWLADPEHLSEIAEADAEVRAGHTLSLAEVRAQLAARR